MLFIESLESEGDPSLHSLLLLCLYLHQVSLYGFLPISPPLLPRALPKAVPPSVPSLDSDKEAWPTESYKGGGAFILTLKVVVLGAFPILPWVVENTLQFSLSS